MAVNPHSWKHVAAHLGGAITGVNAGGTLDIEELDAGDVNVGADTFPFNDADDSETYEESFADLATAMKGTTATTALTASSGVLSVSTGGATALTAPAVGDKILVCDVDDTNKNKSATLANVAKAIGEVAAGTNATSALSEVDGVMRVNIAGTDGKTAPVAADSILINDSEAADINKSCTFTNMVKAIGSTMAGDGLAATAGVLAVDLNELTEAAAAVDADYVPFIDADGNVSRKEAIADIVGGTAGDGLAATAGVLSVDLHELTEAVAAIATDYIPFVDSDGNVTRKDAIADVIGAAAGDGLTATSGVLALTTNTDWQMVIPLASGIANGGTWTPTVTSNVYTVVRTANNATEYWYVPIALPNRTTSSKGAKLTSVDVAYSLTGSDTVNDDLEIHIVKNTVGTDGNATTGAVLAGDDDTDYDDAHNTKAERLDPTGAPELHTATVTIPVGEQAYAADNETYWLSFMVKDNAGADLTLILTGAVANFTETLG